MISLIKWKKCYPSLLGPEWKGCCHLFKSWIIAINYISFVKLTKFHKGFYLLGALLSLWLTLPDVCKKIFLLDQLCFRCQFVHLCVNDFVYCFIQKRNPENALWLFSCHCLFCLSFNVDIHCQPEHPEQHEMRENKMKCICRISFSS